MLLRLFLVDSRHRLLLEPLSLLLPRRSVGTRYRGSLKMNTQCKDSFLLVLSSPCKVKPVRYIYLSSWLLFSSPASGGNFVGCMRRGGTNRKENHECSRRTFALLVMPLCANARLNVEKTIVNTTHEKRLWEASIFSPFSVDCRIPQNTSSYSRVKSTLE